MTIPTCPAVAASLDPADPGKRAEAKDPASGRAISRCVPATNFDTYFKQFDRHKIWTGASNRLMLLDVRSREYRLTVGLKMTESEWMACDEPWKLLRYLRENGSARKLRLVACGAKRFMVPKAVKSVEYAEL